MIMGCALALCLKHQGLQGYPDSDELPPQHQIFQTLGPATVSTSLMAYAQFGILIPTEVDLELTTLLPLLPSLGLISI